MNARTFIIKHRHFGRDAEIQRPWMANFGVLHCPNEALVQTFKLPFMAWIPASLPVCLHFCSAGLVYNDERGAWER